MYNFSFDYTPQYTNAFLNIGSQDIFSAPLNLWSFNSTINSAFIGSALPDFNMPLFNFTSAKSNVLGSSQYSLFKIPAFNFSMPQFDFKFSLPKFNSSNVFSMPKVDSNQSSKSSVGGSTKETALTIYQKCRKNADKRGLTLEFFENLVKVCNNIQCDPMDMLAKMWASSRWKTNAVNKTSGAVGLTQIKPEILRRYGVNPEDYRNMSAIEQLDIIEKYFLKNKKKCNMEGQYLKGEDLFAMNFLSSRANQQVLVKSRSDRYYDPKRDKNNDGVIDKGDMRAVCDLKMKEMLA